MKFKLITSLLVAGTIYGAEPGFNKYHGDTEDMLPPLTRMVKFRLPSPRFKLTSPSIPDTLTWQELIDISLDNENQHVVPVAYDDPQDAAFGWDIPMQLPKFAAYLNEKTSAESHVEKK